MRTESQRVFGLGEKREQLLDVLRRERTLVGRKLRQVVGGGPDEGRPLL